MRKSGSSKIDVRSSREAGVERSTRNLEPRTSNGASRVFATRWGWVGLSASARGVRTLVLPKASRREVERALTNSPGSKFEVRSLGTGRKTGRRREKNPQPRTSNLEPLLENAHRQILAYLAGTRRTLDVPLDLSEGSAFQRRVWRAIRRIPYGRVRSYKWVALRVGGAQYARAVGLALGANPVPLVIPCHRVVTSGGSLGGFTGGLRLKRRLLALEGTLALVAPAGKRREARGKRMGMSPLASGPVSLCER